MIFGDAGVFGALPAGLHIYGRGYGFLSGGVGADDQIQEQVTGQSQVDTEADDQLIPVLQSGLLTVDSDDAISNNSQGAIGIEVESDNTLSQLATGANDVTVDSDSQLVPILQSGSLTVDSDDQLTNSLSGASSIDVDSEDLLSPIPTGQVNVFVDAVDEESNTAIAQSSVEVDAIDILSILAQSSTEITVEAQEVNGTITVIFLPGIKVNLTPHAMRPRSGRQIALEYKEADTLPNLQFTITDECLNDIPLPSGVILKARISNPDSETVVVLQELQILESTYTLKGTHLSTLEPRQYFGEVQIFYTGVLIMTSETFNLEITRNLDY